MHLSFFEFWRETIHSPPLFLTVFLIMAVLIVNGWTDAPNAIAGAVVTGALSFQAAAALAAVCNFWGVLCVTSVNAEITETIYSMVSFQGSIRESLTALCAAMFSVVLWGVLAWKFGIPTSESHALTAGITGAAVALNGNLNCIRWESWGKVIAGLILSICAGLWLGRWARRLIGHVQGECRAFELAQIPGAATSAFFHGAQDGQKFLGIFLLGGALAQGKSSAVVSDIPVWMMLFCAGCMAVGTLIGGRRIIDTVGRDMVTLHPKDGLSADVGSSLCMLLATLLGIPISTTHARTAALLGVGIENGEPVRWSIVRMALFVWLLTFPGCAILGFCCAKYLLHFL